MCTAFVTLPSPTLPEGKVAFNLQSGVPVIRAYKYVWPPFPPRAHHSVLLIAFFFFSLPEIRDLSPTRSQIWLRWRLCHSVVFLPLGANVAHQRTIRYSTTTRRRPGTLRLLQRDGHHQRAGRRDAALLQHGRCGNPEQRNYATRHRPASEAYTTINIPDDHDLRHR